VSSHRVVGHRTLSDPRWSLGMVDAGSSGCATGTVSVAESAEIPSVPTLSVDDAGADHRRSCARRTGARPNRVRARDLRARSILLLPAPYPADPRDGAGGVVAAERRCGRVALRHRAVRLHSAAGPL